MAVDFEERPSSDVEARRKRILMKIGKFTADSAAKQHPRADSTTKSPELRVYERGVKMSREAIQASKKQR